MKRITAADKKCFPGDDLVELTGGIWWVCEENGQLLGYSGLRWLPGHAWYLYRVGVLPFARGRGIAGRLTRSRLTYARRVHPNAPVTTYTMYWNTPSNNNLIRHGFTLYDPPSQFGGEGALYWRLDKP